MDTSKLAGLVPQKVLDELPAVMHKFGINTPLRLAHFLAQCGHESGGFKSVVENLNYSVDGLKRTFGKYFKQNGLAEAYARKPELIASRVYANRMGNGDEGSRDGWRYRGRGYIQLTGKNNYAQFDQFVDDDILANPELVGTKYPLLSAAWFFHKAGILPIADKGAVDAVVTQVTKRVNGGTHGLDDRIARFHKYYKALNTVLDTKVYTTSEFSPDL